MNHQSCEFCGRHIEQIPFGGYSHSADRTAMCGGKPVRARKTPAAPESGGVSSTQAGLPR